MRHRRVLDRGDLHAREQRSLHAGRSDTVLRTRRRLVRHGRDHVRDGDDRLDVREPLLHRVGAAVQRHDCGDLLRLHGLQRDDVCLPARWASLRQQRGLLRCGLHRSAHLRSDMRPRHRRMRARRCLLRRGHHDARGGMSRDGNLSVGFDRYRAGVPSSAKASVTSVTTISVRRANSRSPSSSEAEAGEPV